MQQHSGQHLLSAVIERDYGVKTASWWLGDEICHVELEAPELQVEKIKSIEAIVNEHIREGRNVSVQVYCEDTPEELLAEV